MKILVLGATGSLGSHSVLALLKAGHQVVACGRREDRPDFLAAHRCEYVGGVSLECKQTFKRLPMDFDAIVNLAGAMPGSVGVEPDPYVQSIVVGMLNLLEWMRAGTCRRIIFNTTPLDLSQHFGSNEPVDPDLTRSFPHNGGDHAIYTICKNAAVDLLFHYQVAYGFKPCIFRHRTIYVWTESPYFFSNGERKVMPWRRLVQQCMNGDPVEAWGGEISKKELLYIDDFTSAVCVAVKADACGLFNLPGIRPYSTMEMVTGIADAFCPPGKRSLIKSCPEKLISNQLLLSGVKTKKELGWEARIPWPEACRKMHEIMCSGGSPVMGND